VPPGRRPGAAGSLPPHGPAVLVVDDDADLLALLTLALRRAGLRTVHATNGRAALETLAVEQVDCVVCDLSMPGMNGLDLVRTLRSQPDTATLPFIVLTGSGDGGSVIGALDAGADDFLAKPIRLDELIARVRAHIRTQTAWTDVVIAGLRTRADAIQAIGQMQLSTVPETAAEAIVTELARRIGSEFVGVYRLVGEDALEPVATWNATDGLVLGGVVLPLVRGRYLVDRLKAGPWAERLTGPEPDDADDAFWAARPDIAAGVPIYSGEDLVGMLSIAMVAQSPTATIPMLLAKLLASAIDYASVLGAVAGPAIVDLRRVTQEKADLRRILARREFFPVYQPVVEMRTGRVIGHEALTRFTDGTPPEVRFSRAASVGLGFDFELGAIDAAIAGASAFAGDGFLALNVSPGLVLANRRLQRLLGRCEGPIVLEVSEHDAIADYVGLRRAIRRLGNVELAVDDAGAGFASLRHILEIEPAWVKLDMSLVRNIDADPLRQSLVAGLAHFAGRSGQRLIAEGVERQEEADCLLELGVEFAQGYLYGRPERSA
jgi:EAL domain-containing protein (putative c-di-GMP-specific phosphodiesterase class I)/DNA-binding response OmpR family regulator